MMLLSGSRPVWQIALRVSLLWSQQKPILTAPRASVGYLIKAFAYGQQEEVVNQIDSHLGHAREYAARSAIIRQADQFSRGGLQHSRSSPSDRQAAGSTAARFIASTLRLRFQATPSPKEATATASPFEAAPARRQPSAALSGASDSLSAAFQVDMAGPPWQTRCFLPPISAIMPQAASALGDAR